MVAKAMQMLKDKLDVAEAQRNEWEDNFRKYGDHLYNCANERGDPCSCGFITASGEGE